MEEIQSLMQGFAIALGGTYEALQAALPCLVRRAIPRAASSSRERDEGRSTPSRMGGRQAA